MSNYIYNNVLPGDLKSHFLALSTQTPSPSYKEDEDTHAGFATFPPFPALHLEERVFDVTLVSQVSSACFTG